MGRSVVHKTIQQNKGQNLNFSHKSKLDFFCMLGNFSNFLPTTDFFFQNHFKNTFKVSNSVDPNCLQRLPAGSRQEKTVKSSTKVLVCIKHDHIGMPYKLFSHDTDSLIERLPVTRLNFVFHINRYVNIRTTVTI